MGRFNPNPPWLRHCVSRRDFKQNSYSRPTCSLCEKCSGAATECLRLVRKSYAPKDLFTLIHSYIKTIHMRSLVWKYYRAVRIVSFNRKFVVEVFLKVFGNCRTKEADGSNGYEIFVPTLTKVSSFCLLYYQGLEKGKQPHLCRPIGKQMTVCRPRPIICLMTLAHSLNAPIVSNTPTVCYL